ncbi:MAG TPA: pyridoxamine 5'-phosphate oxidase [Candidatus Thermoplasmatota archaeon]|nr:pyridoxamine 5'-phosphate oxidase [Candidatus Thermoplasmatota archaeon]
MASEPDHPLHRADLAPDPFGQFQRWWAARAASTAQHPDAVALATVGAEGQPSLRMVLLKGADARGFRFFTNGESRKGQELAANPRAALLVYDEAKGRQIRIEGTVHPLPPRESDAYWQSRHRGSQLSALVSRQSRPVPDRDTMERAWEEAAARYEGEPVPRPPWWGGYLLRPERFEFWQHRESRFHDRFAYTPDGPGWRIERLWP